MTPGSETPRPRRRSGKRGGYQAAKPNEGLSSNPGQVLQDARARENASVLDHPPARRKAGEVASLLEFLDRLPVAHVEEGGYP